MLSAATRLGALSALSLLVTACSHAVSAAASDAPAPVRAAPSRPGGAALAAPPPASTATAATRKPGPPLPVTQIKGTDYVSANDIAARLGFRGTWDESRRELTLVFSGSRTLVLTAEKREVASDGRRIFLGDAVQLRAGKLFVAATDYERCLLPLLRPEQVAEPVPRLRTIVLDPGHGGGDPGMENSSLRLQEKVLALDVAQRLEKLLRAEGYSVVLTRREDRQLAPTKEADLQRRAIIANAAGADLFVSIHFNSLFPDTRVAGTEVYVFTRAGQRSDTSWGFGQRDDTETDLAPVNRYDPWSSLLAHSLHREIIGGLKTSDRGHKTKHLAVLRALNCPGVLVESLFLSNPDEARRAATPAYRQQIAQSLFAGIRGYAATLESLRPKATAPSATAPRPAASNSP